MIFSFTRIPDGPVEEFLAFARAGYDLGFRRLWIPDQTYYADPFVLLAQVAREVPQLELGLAVTNPYTRHPVQIARAAATVAEVAGGRLLLGLGAGNRKHLIDRLGLDGRHAPERVREAALLIRRLLAGETVRWDGYWTLHEVALQTAGRPEVPIIIGTRNPKMLRVAGEVGDGVMLESLVSPEAQAYGLDEVRLGARRAGRSLEGFEVVAWQSVRVTDDRAGAIEALRPWAAYLLGMTTPAVAARMGVDPEVTRRVHDAFAAEGPEAAARFVGADEVDRFVIAGSPSDVAVRCAALFRGGATDFAVQVTRVGARQQLLRFAQEVRPLIEGMLAGAGDPNVRNA
ncbi:MAG: LLM class flavin-dependent oxidoreductase [Armatimonadota bacterium]|nr:LLM class flavin-dependent oxidoreductase [Armatimonadota bacterium]MDR7451216.1 LLM class flavin-dependent oxidoreductase [Armatimonadota bacterium]MDR7467179.1 LLM class flavin-dependent oxidoreductase [Armatimonadota bacterium]MDR7495192.1 LLM class flavin-dependent oxidoreductase [Armatimonadota bacterium]MDR7500097.1 LLM class flavin-dependent oxidoreductase [Armatimonadota bacterium]